MESLRSFFEKVKGYDTGSGTQDQAKKAAAAEALGLVESGMTLGLGTGSTVEFFLQGLAERVSQGLQVTGIPTSSVTERRAQELSIPLVENSRYPHLKTDLCVDGADRVDVNGFLVKGGGGALLREKLVAANSSRVCILVDPSKLKMCLDETFAIPVECVDFGVESTMAQIARMGCDVTLRTNNQEDLYQTDNGNVIVDCRFPCIEKPRQVELALLAMPGVVEVGIFSDLLHELIAGFADGSAFRWSSE